MKTWALTLLILSATTAAWGGLALTVDNDFFTGSDGCYTHGTEIAWYDLNPWGIYFTGLRNRVYTPKDITLAENQPDDHPWCGMLMVFYEQGIIRGCLRTKYGVEAGVLGPSAMAEEQQTWLHKVTGSDKPMGWDNQLRNEPVLNAYLDNWYGLGPTGRANEWSVRPDLLYGGVVGTVNANLYSGVGLRAGYNIPPDWGTESGLAEDAPSSKFFGYGLASVKGTVVAYNATLGQSLFYGVDEEHHVDLKPILGEAKVGLCLGYGSVSLTGLVTIGTKEFEGQDGLTEWGEICLMFGRPF